MSQTDTVADASQQLERFHKSYRVNPANECWEWQLSLSPDGYGRCYFNGVNVRAHRLSYEIHYGTFPRHFLVCHKCDNPRCVNPSHLFLGDVQTNMRDKKEKGRSKGINKGTRNAMSRLSDDDVSEIRKLLASGLSQAKVAKTFNVNQSHISRINSGLVR